MALHDMDVGTANINQSGTDIEVSSVKLFITFCHGLANRKRMINANFIKNMNKNMGDIE